MKKQFSAIEQALQMKKGGAQPMQPMQRRGASARPYFDAQDDQAGENGMAEGFDGGGQPSGAGFDDIRDEIVRLIREGKLSEDFDLQQACMDDAFAALLAELPPEAAVRVYEAEKRAEEAEQTAMQRVSTQVKSRNALPKSSRGGAMSAPGVNYRDMDSATFRKMLSEIKKTTRNGGKVRL